jgi:hypothetical protein
MEAGVKQTSPEALFLITRATEIFIAKLAQDSSRCAEKRQSQESQQQVVKYDDLVEAWKEDETLGFLKSKRYQV